MNVRCPHCGTEYDVEKKEMYRYVKCEACGKGFVAGAATSLQKGKTMKAINWRNIRWHSGDFDIIFSRSEIEYCN